MDTLKKNTEAKLKAQTEARDAEAKVAELEKEKLEQAKKMQEWMDAMAAKGINVSNLPPAPGVSKPKTTAGSSSQVKFSDGPTSEKTGTETTGAGAPLGPGAQ